MANRKRKPEGSVCDASRQQVPIGAPSERIVPIPEITVFSELPFKRIGVIGGRAIPPNQLNASKESNDRAPSAGKSRGRKTEKPEAKAASRGAKKPARRKKVK